MSNRSSSCRWWSVSKSFTRNADETDISETMSVSLMRDSSTLTWDKSGVLRRVDADEGVQYVYIGSELDMLQLD